MPDLIFEHIKHYIYHMWRYETIKKIDQWWEIINSVEYFNKNREKTVDASIWKVLDKCMYGFFHELQKRWDTTT